MILKPNGMKFLCHNPRCKKEIKNPKPQQRYCSGRCAFGMFRIPQKDPNKYHLDSNGTAGPWKINKYRKSKQFRD